MDLQAVVLCAATTAPLASDDAGQCLLNVATRPLLWYTLQALRRADVESVVVAVRDSPNVSTLRSWIGREAHLPPCEVLCVEEEASQGDAVRQCLPKLSAATVVVVRLGVVTDAPLRSVVAAHQMGSAAATMVLHKQTSSAAARTKSGKAPRGVDYVGLDAEKQHLVFFQSSPETLRSLKIPFQVLQIHPQIDITTDYRDAGIYVLSKEMLALFGQNATWREVSADLIPYLIRTPLRRLPGDVNGHEAQGRGQTEQGVAPFFLTPQEYLSVVSGPKAFGDTVKEVMGVRLRTSLAGLPDAKQESFVQSNVALGNKTTVSGPCLVCDGTAVGEKTTVKRSFVGKNCKIGAGCKVINAVILENAVVGNQCHIQSSIVGAGTTIGQASQVKDSIIGPEYVVAESSSLNEEIVPGQ